jgi:hypothetical protein
MFVLEREESVRSGLGEAHHRRRRKSHGRTQRQESPKRDGLDKELDARLVPFHDYERCNVEASDFMGRRRMAVTTHALDEAGERVSRYLLMQTMVNGWYGVLVRCCLTLARPGLCLCGSDSSIDVKHHLAAPLNVGDGFAEGGEPIGRCDRYSNHA